MIRHSPVDEPLGSPPSLTESHRFFVAAAMNNGIHCCLQLIRRKTPPSAADSKVRVITQPDPDPLRLLAGSSGHRGPSARVPGPLLKEYYSVHPSPRYHVLSGSYTAFKLIWWTLVEETFLRYDNMLGDADFVFRPFQWGSWENLAWFQ